jgi:hypothetical protein
LLSLEFSLNASPSLTLRSLLVAKWKIINKDLYRERSNEVHAKAKKYDSFRISQALSGGSTKCLVQAAEFVPLPMSINTTDGSGKLITTSSRPKLVHTGKNFTLANPHPLLINPGSPPTLSSL